MPHKRAKLSTRQSERAKRGTDLPPTGGVPLAQETVPKSMARVLQAESVRMVYREKRVRLDDGEREGQRDPKRHKKGGEPASIKHSESLAQFNRRVEDEMRIQVAEAMHTSRSANKRARKIDQAATMVKSTKVVTLNSMPAAPKEMVTHNANAPKPARKTEFDNRERTTRLNDIVQAPPSLTKLPRGVTKHRAQGGSVALHKGDVVSMVQKQRMEGERERAIKRYRELKSLRDTAQMK